jgi:ethanolamine utilization protein EutN/carbon dioxide concentrating mechanism protein CcmL
MLIGKVVGTVVSTAKDEKMQSLRLMVVRQLTIDGQESGGYVVAVDAVGSGVGEVVLYASGSSARQTVLTDKRPVDAVIMAIVDTWEVDGQVRYRKEGEIG